MTAVISGMQWFSGICFQHRRLFLYVQNILRTWDLLPFSHKSIRLVGPVHPIRDGWGWDWASESLHAGKTRTNIALWTWFSLFYKMLHFNYLIWIYPFLTRLFPLRSMIFFFKRDRTKKGSMRHFRQHHNKQKGNFEYTKNIWFCF